MGRGVDGVGVLVCHNSDKVEIAFWLGSSDRAEDVNDVLMGLSYSYLAGYIFYLLTVSLPHWKTKNKMGRALRKKVNTIREIYKACLESVLPLNKSLAENATQDEVKELFKGVSYMEACRLAKVGQNVSVARYIRAKHDENVVLAGQLLEYKQWLASESIVQIETIRSSDLGTVIVALTIPDLLVYFDNEDSRKKLAVQVYDLWEESKKINI